MKDAYSFHDTQESLQVHYDEMARAYGRICERLGLEYRPVEADSGQIGGKVTTEFMALAESGEAELVYCSCGFAANTEVAEAKIATQIYEVDGLTKIHTPRVATIAELANFLNVSESATVKALSGMDGEGNIVVLFVPGDHELGDIKAEKALPGFRMLGEEEMLESGLVKGFMGPVGLPNGVRVVADNALRVLPQWLIGANETDYHFAGAKPGVDFNVDIWADLCTAKSGDLCPECGLPLQDARGIEVGQVFQLGTKYSVSMSARYMDEAGAEQPFLMGCYGWGVTRSLAAVVEQYNDEYGIKWPMSIAPAEVAVIPLTVGDELVEPAALRIANELLAAGIEVVLDDRDDRAGVKFNDADLIGWPYQVVVGKRGLEAGEVELKIRLSGEKRSLPLEQVVAILVQQVADERKKYQ